MINSVTNNAQTVQAQQTQQRQQQTIQAPKKQQEPQDSVVLSKQASGSGDVDHDGDSH
jgi:hypothetical protein